MNIDSIQNGYVIDHIKGGKGMDIYSALRLSELSCPLAMMRNVPSEKMGKKDIIKIDSLIDLDLDVLGYLDPEITVNVIENGKCVRKFHPELPTELRGILTCKNPRCITSIEQELPHVFRLTDPENRVYRCIYCEAKAKRR